MALSAYFASLSLLKLIKNVPGGIAQGLIWGLMALGVYITFRLLDAADLTVDGSFTLGGAVAVMLILGGWPAWAAVLVAVAAGILAGMCTGLLHVKLGIPIILSGILTQFSLYSINLRIMGMAANKALSVDKFDLLLSSRYIPSAILTAAVIALVLVSVFYWYFGTQYWCEKFKDSQTDSTQRDLYWMHCSEALKNQGHRENLKSSKTRKNHHI